MTEQHDVPISRRDLFRLARTFGWTSLVMAASAISGSITLPQLAKASESTYKSRFTKKPKLTLTYATTVAGKRLLEINAFGYLEFVRDIEERTDGEIRIELIEGSEICNELTCVKKAMQGIVDIYSSSIQNAAGVAVYFDVLNFPYLFPSRASQYYFFYHPKSETLLRAPLRKHHGIHLLFNHCRLRGIVMGMKWKNKPDINTIEELAGAKIRSTNSKLALTALKLLKMEPIPLDWNETLNALRFGLIDGMETWEGAAAGMSFEQNVISQVFDICLFSGNTHAAMRADIFDKLSPEHQNAIMESAYFTQIWHHFAGEASLVNTVGASNPSKQGTIFADKGIRFIIPSEKELIKMQQMCSPEFNPKPWEKMREDLNSMAGNIDIYQEIHTIAREIPSTTLAENVIPRRWWKS
ncbi:MAG: TRAP transporter substrate-binding protein DctP [Desulfobacterales bacterium]|nr:TRAP transporter substrate-binding protein DctP [Desulfobacterales bacterium]